MGQLEAKMSDECRVIDGRLCLKHPKYGWQPILPTDPANAKWKEAWENFKTNELIKISETTFEQQLRFGAYDGHYLRVKRECERCEGTGTAHKILDTFTCPACANNVEPGFVYILEPIK
jgi:hypothetical protein